MIRPSNTAWALAGLMALLPACGGTLAPTDQTGPSGGGTGGAGGVPKGGMGGTGAAGAGVGGSSGTGAAGLAGAPTAGGGGSQATCKPSVEGEDRDGDGFTFPADCDDASRFVNPGAFEVPGDGVDNDCDGGVDVVATGCDDASDPLPFDTTDGLALARAMGICSGGGWWVYDAYIQGFSAGDSVPAAQYGVQAPLGAQFAPRQGNSVLMLSTRIARFSPQPGWDGPFTNSGRSTFPIPGFPVANPPCPATNPNVAWDPLALRVRMRVPTNAARATFKVAFGTEEYRLASCNDANDVFAVHMESGPTGQGTNHALLPGGAPISVDTAPFSFCEPTSFQVDDKVFTYPCEGGLASPTDKGIYSTEVRAGWTDWITVSVPVVAGLDSELVLSMWGAGFKQSFSSAVLIDGWTWEQPTNAPSLCPK